EGFIRYGINSEPITLKVKPLPDSNRPPEFSGIVGHGEMTLQVEPSSITIGDPITLTLHLKGFENPEAILLPPVSTLAPFTGQFLIPSQQSPPRIQNNDALFTQSIRPLRTAVTGIPSLKLVTFNPDSGEYETLSTAPVPISVRPDGETTAIDLGPDSPSSQKPNPEGIWQNMLKDEIEPLSLAGSLASHSVFLWTLLPLTLWVLLSKPARIYRLKKSDPETWRQRVAFSLLKKALTKTADAERQRSALGDYLATRLRIRKEAVTHHEIKRAMEGRGITIDETLSTCLHELFDRGDLAEFGRDPKTVLQSIDSEKL
ncbi:MAG: hypothetical protein V4507_09750, partial [Verrucomicrobiota bacterium]